MAMTLPSTVSNCVDSKPDIAMGVLSQGPRRAPSVEETASARGGPGIQATPTRLQCLTETSIC